MGRTDASLRILAAGADMQRHIAVMLEAKADEMETLRNWLLVSVRTSRFADAEGLLSQTVSFHEHLIEILTGVVKMEQGLAQHMQLLLEEEPGSEGVSDLNRLLSLGGPR
jgi:hypothetical protein